MFESLKPFTCRQLPDELLPLADLALDVRWTWNHGSDHLWESVDAQTWRKTRNPWWMLQSISQERLERLRQDTEFLNEMERLTRARKDYLDQPGWYPNNYPQKKSISIAYFSMEFGLSEAIPLYAGGLGMLAGDFLKTASDLHVPLIGVGLLYQQGYFRQVLARDGTQMAANPPNDPITLPITPVTDARGGWQTVSLALPGRELLLRAWKVQVGRATLYLLDSNDPTNDPSDRSIIHKLYDDQTEFRLLQEMILGIAGWKLLDKLGIHPEVCHLNEGHAAFVVLERARTFMQETGQPFPVALWATRAGNVFTTHTAVTAGFDQFPSSLVTQYFNEYSQSLGISVQQLLELGQQTASNAYQPFNMALLAMRGCSAITGVSQLHGKISRQLFQPLFSRWPQYEVPVKHITNGVHASSWDSEEADRLWTEVAGKGCWCTEPDNLSPVIKQVSDEEIWALRNSERRALVDYVRLRKEHQFRQNAAPEAVLQELRTILNPNVLTIGFARRFTDYKRPNLLLQDRDRLLRLLSDTIHPIQIVIAGKAHPGDEEGKRLVQEMVQFSQKPETKCRLVFLSDYDMGTAQQLVQGIDLWINTPRRPWEACGTSGMKILVNGGLNLSELDGWWAEAYNPSFGWSIGDGQEHDSSWDIREARQLYELLENEVIPEFYDRNEKDIPVRWVNRIRANMCCLAPQYSSNRMLREYIEKIYIPASHRLSQRTAENSRMAVELLAWQQSLQNEWGTVKFGQGSMVLKDGRWQVKCEVCPGKICLDHIRVELFADPVKDSDYIHQELKVEEKLAGRENYYLFTGTVPANRPAEHYSLRIIPAHQAAVVPLEDHHIIWKYPIQG